jgi:hypothetical protein
MRRTEDSDWVPIATVDADPVGKLGYDDTSVISGMAYQYRLAIPVETRIYYRGDIAAVAAVAANSFSVVLEGANPSMNAPRVVITNGLNGRCELLWTDASGRAVRAESLELGPGRHLVALPQGPRLQPGVYFMRTRMTGHEKIARFVLVR